MMAAGGVDARLDDTTAGVGAVMAVIPTLIYCAGGNRRGVEIAVSAGFRYGARLPSTTYTQQIGRLYFADQDWKKPNRSAYMAALAKHRPTMATVLDWEREDQLAEVLNWATEAAQYVEIVQIVPKVVGGIDRLPRRIGGRPVVLGYSVHTTFGGTPVPAWEYAGWPLHLLGGSPHQQMRLWSHFANSNDVWSVDGNFVGKMSYRGQIWVPGVSRSPHGRYWESLSGWGNDMPYEALRRSCANVLTAWHELCTPGRQPCCRHRNTMENP